MKRILLVALLLSLLACSSSSSSPSGSGGTFGGVGGVGQPAGTGGTVGSGGSVANGGSLGTGGSVASGGTVGSGGSTGSGGVGGPGGSGGATGQSDPLQAVCEAQCARQLSCFPDKFPSAADKTTCIPTCMAKSPPAVAFRDGVLLAVAACARDLACDGNDDVCILRAAAQQDPNWISSPDGKACLATCKTCNASGYPVGYADEECALFVIFSPSTLAAFNDCLAKPCPEVADCVGAVIPL